MGNSQIRNDITVYEYQPKNSYRLWLVGDSILDNSYWNDVGVNNTAEILRKMIPAEKVEVIDRATEELDSMQLNQRLRSGQPIQVAYHYVANRQKIGVPYDPPDGNVDPNFDPQPNDFLIISVGGNDFALRGEMNPTEILKHVRQVLQYYKSKGMNPSHIFYMTPYPPTGLMKTAVFASGRGNLSKLYKQFIREAKAMCEEEGTQFIPLDHFKDKERDNAGTGIPEPTPYGAIALAKLIQEAVARQIEIEEN